MSALHCPACHDDLQQPAAQVRDVAVCPNCGASFVIAADGSTRRATADDTTVLSNDELQTLRKARRRTR